jgi:hypothetical protein
MVVSNAAFQRDPQLGDLLPQATASRLRQTGGVLLAHHHRFQHGAPRHPQDIGSHRAQFDVGVFEHLLNAIGNIGRLPAQNRPVTSEIPQIADRFGRNEAPPEQSMLEQVPTIYSSSDRVRSHAQSQPAHG